MHIWMRVLVRARVLTHEWALKNAFELGMFFGGGVTLLVFLIH